MQSAIGNMKRELCILHIGSHKTGTSSLQEFFKKSLYSTNFHYTSSSEINHNRVLMSIILDNLDNYHGNKSSGIKNNDLLNYINNEIYNFESDLLNGQSNVTEIISAEDLSNLIDADVAKLKSYLYSFFNHVQVVVYVRNIRTYANSSFQELVKHGLNQFDLKRCVFNFNCLLSYYNYFGGQNLLILNYDQASKKKGGVVADFCENIGFPFILDHNSHFYLNKALSLEACCFIFLFQKYYYRVLDPSYWDYQNKFIDFLSDYGFSSFSFGFESYSFIKNTVICNIDDVIYDLIPEEILSVEFGNEEVSIRIESESDMVNVCLSNLNGLLHHARSRGVDFNLSAINELAALDLLKAIDTYLNGKESSILLT